MENYKRVIDMEGKTAIIDNLQRYLGEGINLREKLQEIIIKIDETTDFTIKKNLQAWKAKYIKRINDTQYFNTDMYVNVHNKVNELFVENYIATLGLHFENIDIKKFERQKIISIGKIAGKTIGKTIGKIDLLGYQDGRKIIIEIKGYEARSSVIGQVLAYWQYYKEIEGDDCPVIIIAPGFTEQYRFAFNSIGNINIRSLVYRFYNNGIEFKKWA